MGTFKSIMDDGVGTSPLTVDRKRSLSQSSAAHVAAGARFIYRRDVLRQIRAFMQLTLLSIKMKNEAKTAWSVARLVGRAH